MENLLESSLIEELRPARPLEVRRIVGVRIRGELRLIDCDAGDALYRMGEYVVVETRRGRRLAEVIRPMRSYLHHGERVPRILRRAGDEDLERAARMARREDEALIAGVRIVQEKNYPLKLIAVEWSDDGAKATVYFCTEDKVDLREFVYELGAQFHCRIEMRNVGIRDQAGMAGGIGDCGRELCCSSWLQGFIPISIKMAKNQNLALDNEKLTGQCGRLKCCLSYEDEVYKIEQKKLPKRGFKFEMNGGRYVVLSTNVLLRKVLLQGPEGAQQLLEIDSFNAILQKPEVTTLSQVKFIDEESRQRALALAPDVTLEEPTGRRPQSAGERQVAPTDLAEAQQAAAALGEALRDSAPEGEPQPAEPARPAGRSETRGEAGRDKPGRGRRRRRSGGRGRGGGRSGGQRR